MPQLQKYIRFCLTLFLTGSFADSFAEFTYVLINEGNEIEIIDIQDPASLQLTIPAQIEGKPVTQISDFAFYNCHSLQQVSLPNTITKIWSGTFQFCEALTHIQVDAENPQYRSIDGVLYNADLSILHSYPRGKSGTYTLPNSVSSIGQQAFQDCSGLTEITLPDSLTHIADQAFSGCHGLTHIVLPKQLSHIGSFAFYDCDSLTQITLPASVTHIDYRAFYDCLYLTEIIFAGDAPAFLNSSVFSTTTPSLRLTHLDSARGFDASSWPYATLNEINTTTYPHAYWLISHLLPYQTEMHSDHNQDGFSLMLAYAFNLDPHQPITPHLPRAFITDNTLAITFYAGRADINYRVETCTDLSLADWTEAGVTLSTPDSQQYRTATIPLNAPQRFMRIQLNQTSLTPQ